MSFLDGLSIGLPVGAVLGVIAFALGIREGERRRAKHAKRCTPTHCAFPTDCPINCTDDSLHQTPADM